MGVVEWNDLRLQVCSHSKFPDDKMATVENANAIVRIAVTLGIGRHIMAVRLQNVVKLLQVRHHISVMEMC